MRNARLSSHTLSSFRFSGQRGRSEGNRSYSTRTRQESLSCFDRFKGQCSAGLAERGVRAGCVAASEVEVDLYCSADLPTLH